MDKHVHWILVLIVAQQAETVYWTARTPIQFYKNTVFQCKIQTHGIGTTKWTGGYMNEILTYNEGSLYKDKYSAEFNLEKNVYYLKITNFNEHDVNVVYTCFYGFDKYSRNLTIDENQFELIPKNDTVNRMLTCTNGVLKLNVTFMKVWPGPQCSLTVNNKEVTGLMKNHTRKGAMFLQSFFTYGQTIDESEVSVIMSCRIGTKQYTVFDKRQSNSNLKINHESNTGILMSRNSENSTSIPVSRISENSSGIPVSTIIIIVVIVSVVVGSILIFVMFWLFRRTNVSAENAKYIQITPPVHGPSAAGPMPG